MFSSLKRLAHVLLTPCLRTHRSSENIPARASAAYTAARRIRPPTHMPTHTQQRAATFNVAGAGLGGCLVSPADPAPRNPMQHNPPEHSVGSKERRLAAIRPLDQSCPLGGPRQVRWAYRRHAETERIIGGGSPHPSVPLVGHTLINIHGAVMEAPSFREEALMRIE